MTRAALAERQHGLVAVDGKSYPLLAAQIRARAAGGLAETVLVQRFANPYPEPLEVVYTMPLPAEAAVLGYTIRLGERRIVGEIESLEIARAAYTKALLEGRTAGLFEQRRADTFVQKLGSLPPGVEVDVELRVLHPLAFRARSAEAACEWEYRFPTVVGVRYQGAPGRVPDAGDLDVDRADAAGTPARLELALELGDGDPRRLAPRSPSHAIDVRAAERGCQLTFPGGCPLDRDVVVLWRAAEEQVGARLVEGPGLPGDAGRYALLTLTPPADAAPVLPRDLTVLIDASGSMSDEPLELAKRVVRMLLGGLTSRDRFEILAFAHRVHVLVKGPAHALPAQVEEAIQRLNSLQASGATEMAEAIARALAPLREDAQRQVLLVTDGQIGFERQVVQNILRGLPASCRLHAVAVGSAPNRTLTRGGARAGRGIEVVVDDERSADDAAAQLLRATVGPVLTDITIGGAAVRAVAPARPRDVMAGQPLVAVVNLHARGGEVEVRGRLAGSAEPWARSLAVPAKSMDACGLPIGALFGREAVEDLEMKLAASNGRNERVENEIETLGLRHRIVTRRTSLVAVAEEPSVDPREPRRRYRMDVELPAGVSAEGLGLEAGPMIVEFAACRPASPDVYHAYPEDHFQALPARLWMQRVRARVVHEDDRLLVLEFDLPHHGFRPPRPGSVVHLHVPGQPAVEAFVDGSSSRSGEYAAGLTAILVLRRASTGPWPPAHLVTWEQGGETIKLEIVT
ncbi:MAG: VWA domain-containing protein [Acidobacteria bacterium]|nr:VWA domain-containing protein [Acidobacteriota bacterium]